MAKIDEILGQSAATLAAMNDEQLKEYLKEPISLEPLSRPAITGVEVKVSKRRTKSVEADDGDDNPIKGSKAKKGKLKGLDLILQMKRELTELGIDPEEESEEE